MSHIQTILIDRRDYTKKDAKKLVKRMSRHYKTTAIKKKIHYKFRQRAKNRKKYFYQVRQTKKGVYLVIGKPKEDIEF